MEESDKRLWAGITALVGSVTGLTIGIDGCRREYDTVLVKQAQKDDSGESSSEHHKHFAQIRHRFISIEKALRDIAKAVKSGDMHSFNLSFFHLHRDVRALQELSLSHEDALQLEDHLTKADELLEPHFQRQKRIAKNFRDEPPDDLLDESGLIAARNLQRNLYQANNCDIEIPEGSLEEADSLLADTTLLVYKRMKSVLREVANGNTKILKGDYKYVFQCQMLFELLFRQKPEYAGEREDLVRLRNEAAAVMIQERFERVHQLASKQCSDEEESEYAFLISEFRLMQSFIDGDAELEAAHSQAVKDAIDTYEKHSALPKKEEGEENKDPPIAKPLKAYMILTTEQVEAVMA